MDKPSHIDKILIDGDILAYRAAFATQDKPPWETEDSLDQLISYITEETVVFRTTNNMKIYLTGQGNFRNEVAKTHPYKGNRNNVERPHHLPYARDYLVEKHKAVVVDGMEADDAIATEAMIGDPKANVIVSQDKDFLTVPTWMFNFVKGTWVYSTEWEALKFFYTQILTGDSSDNIKGIHRVGPVKAGKILDGAESEYELYQFCVKAYFEDLLKGEGLDGDWFPVEDFLNIYRKKAEERVLENARLLHLCRYVGEVWEPPKQKGDSSVLG